MGVKVRVRDGAWWLFIDHKGKRKAKRVGVGPPGKKAARLAAEKIQAKLALGDVTVFDPEPVATAAPTFRAVYEEWLQKYPALNAIRPSTLHNYRSFAEQHLVPFFGDKPVTAITVQAVEDFIEAKRAPGGSVRRKGKALSDGSLRTGLLALRLILKRAVRRKLIPASPMGDLEWRGMPHVEQVDPFGGAELRAVLAAADRLEPDFATLLRVWMQSGMRAGEVTGLQWQDIDTATGIVKVRRTWSNQRLGPTKNAHSTRDVSILHPIAEDTEEWRPGVTEASRAVLHGLRRLTVRSLEPEAFVFQRDGQPLSSMAVHRSWRRVLLAARVRYRPAEQFRHTFASTMLSRNAPLLYVQQQGGWRGASVLLRVYARWMPQPSATQAQPAPSLAPVTAVRNAG
ncbi:MAG: site-specific integrase [Candidatus Rokubacteria bacterium]|nr:site-specific integrase [Candidatus Rokubacteria bacterium]